MPTIRLDARKTNRSLSLRWAPVCALLLAFAAVPLDAQHYQDLYDFLCSTTTGCTPYGTLKQGANGNLYGTTTSGGANNLGTVFMVTLAGAYTDLYDFDATTGAGGGGLTLATVDGNFYGTTANTLFRFNPSTNAFTIMYTFGSSDGTPQGPPVEAKDFNLYGLGAAGENGTAYRWTISTATFDLLPGSVPGFPSGPLFAATDGYLYGATANGGHPEAGELFRLSTTTGAIKKLYSFTDEDDGANPNAPLAEGKDGNLYGTAHIGGYYNDGRYGTIFELSLPSDSFGPVYSFDGSSGAGSNPTAGLLAASDGNFYGTTNGGGMSDLGTIFEWQTGGTYIPLDDFSGNGGLVSGATPNTALMEDTNGLFYGLTAAGGANGEGVFYSLTPPNLLSHINVCCNWFVVLDQPVMVVGQNLSQVISVDFGSVNAQFEPGSDTYLLAFVPSAAIDSTITATFESGLQLETEQAVHILPKITNLDPQRGEAGAIVSISGGGFAGTTKVAFGGVAATQVTVISPAMIQATVPPSAVTGKVEVVTPNGSAKSPKRFTVN